jgi:hypothetical protein
MRLSDRQFLLVTATALLAVATHFGQLPAWLAMCVPTLILLRVAHRRRTQRKVALWLRVPLLFTLLAAIVMQFGNVFGREPGSALACAMLAMKLLETESVRDARAALGFSAFVLMSALLNSQGLGITFAVCASLVPLLAALVALQPAATPTPHVWRSELKTAGALFGLGLPLALAAFLFVPRLGAPLWGSPGGFQDARTGLSDQMSPGSMTDLLIDDSPALRVTFCRSGSHAGHALFPHPGDVGFRRCLLAKLRLAQTRLGRNVADAGRTDRLRNHSGTQHAAVVAGFGCPAGCPTGCTRRCAHGFHAHLGRTQADG